MTAAPRLAHGGSFFDVLRRWIDPDDPTTRAWLMVATIALAWFPLVILSASTKLVSGELDPLLLRVEPHARLLGALGLLLFAEPVLDGRVARVADSVANDGVLRPSSGPSWNAALEKFSRWRDVWLFNLGWLAVAYGALWLAYLELLPDWLARWLLSTLRGVEWSDATAAWWWYVLVAQPLLMMFLLRWVHRWVLWGVLAWRLARLEIDVRAVHADRAGGLGFTTLPLESLRLFILALGIALASVWYDEIAAGRAQTSTFAGDVLLFSILCLAMMLLPYLGFTTKLIRAREAGLVEYGALMRHYAEQFERRWLARASQPREDLLGHPDIAVLADLRASTVGIEETRSLVPSGKDLQAVSIAIALPFVAVGLAQAPSAAQLLMNAVVRLLGG